LNTRGKTIFSQVQKSITSIYADIPSEDLLTSEEFIKKISYKDALGVNYSKGKFIRFDKIESKIDFPPILMTSMVFNGFKSLNPNRNSVANNIWKNINNHEIKNVDVEVYGGNLVWKI
jgi:hypothetical protein